MPTLKIYNAVSIGHQVSPIWTVLGSVFKFAPRDVGWWVGEGGEVGLVEPQSARFGQYLSHSSIALSTQKSKYE